MSTFCFAEGDGEELLQRMLKRSCFLFQITLNFILFIVQFLSYFGLTALENPISFYRVLSAAMPLASFVIAAAGGSLTYRLYQHQKKMLAGVVLVQCAGAVASLLLYREYLVQLSVLSPAKWMLTPYLTALTAALMVAFVLHKIKGKAAV